MCGIAGIVSRSGAATAERIHPALACLAHRGPDGSGEWADASGTIALSHRRLAIIDRSEAGAQPMDYRHYRVLLNGEIYNYLELRAELNGLGHSFHSQSDTEVAVAAFAQWGQACLQKFDGMFALAIWDEEQQQLFLARDRFGEKPLFFHQDEEELFFASEQKALRALGVPFEVNRSLLYNFLSIGYAGNPADPMETFFTGVYKLPAASFAFYDARTGELQVERYWQLGVEVQQPATPVETFRALLENSVARRLRSDVPIGTSLSGGLDSSTIVALCARQASESYSHQCFTASFEGFARDEWNYAAEVAKQFGLKHHRVMIENRELPRLMQQVAAAQEEPFSSASVLAQFAVYREAKARGVTVLLDGQGADEILAGYGKFYRYYWSELYRARNLDKSKELAAARALGVAHPFGWRETAAALFPEFITGLHEGRKEKMAARHPDLNAEFAATFRRGLYLARPLGPTLNDALYFDTSIHGLEELLRLADRNSMAQGIEVRLPFLSHELVEYLFTLPPGLKMHDGWTKWLLRKAMEAELPPSITWRRDKVGFEPPQQHWMQEPGVAELIQEGKRTLVEQGILDAAVLRKLRPHDAYAPEARDWRYWSASTLFHTA